MAVFGVVILTLIATTYFPAGPAAQTSNVLFPLGGITFANLNVTSGSRVGGQLGLNVSEPVSLQFYADMETRQVGTGNSSVDVPYARILPLQITLEGKNYSFAIPTGWNGSAASFPSQGPSTSNITITEGTYPAAVHFSIWLSVPRDVLPGGYLLILTVLGWSPTNESVVQMGKTVQAPVQTGLAAFTIDIAVS